MFWRVVTEHQTCQACHEKIITRSTFMYSESVTTFFFTLWYVCRWMWFDGMEVV